MSSMRHRMTYLAASMATYTAAGAATMEHFSYVAAALILVATYWLARQVLK